eukprot:jgi/Tetstr1/443233/TSEL_031271.t1
MLQSLPAAANKAYLRLAERSVSTLCTFAVCLNQAIARLLHDSTATSDRANADKQNKWRPPPHAAVLVLPLLAPHSRPKIRPELQPRARPFGAFRRRADLAGQ